MQQVIGDRHSPDSSEALHQALEYAGFDDQHDRRNMAQGDKHAADIIGCHADSEHEYMVPLVGRHKINAEKRDR